MLSLFQKRRQLSICVYWLLFSPAPPYTPTRSRTLSFLNICPTTFSCETDHNSGFHFEFVFLLKRRQFRDMCAVKSMLLIYFRLWFSPIWVLAQICGSREEIPRSMANFCYGFSSMVFRSPILDDSFMVLLAKGSSFMRALTSLNVFLYAVYILAAQSFLHVLYPMFRFI